MPVNWTTVNHRHSLFSAGNNTDILGETLFGGIHGGRLNHTTGTEHNRLQKHTSYYIISFSW